MPATYDSIYKTLFAHPEMIHDLLLEFAAVADPKSLDFATLSRVNGSYVALRGDDEGTNAGVCHSDMVWKVRVADRWLYIYLLLEFQSSVDDFMGQRMLLYVAQLLEDLKRRKELSPNRKFHPVLPLVLFNGRGAWRAALGVEALFEPAPPALQPHQPALQYVLIEEARVQTEAVLKKSANLAALWFRLQQTEQFEELYALLDQAEARLAGEEHAALRHDFTQVTRWLLQLRSKDSTIPEMSDLHEVKEMLAERRLEWWERWKLEGEQEGVIKGEARLLQRQLALRFGPLPEWVDPKLAAAAEDDLLRWSESVLTASSLEEIFGR